MTSMEPGHLSDRGPDLARGTSHRPANSTSVQVRGSVGKVLGVRTGAIIVLKYDARGNYVSKVIFWQ